jgi:uncharacterized protein YaeQ
MPMAETTTDRQLMPRQLAQTRKIYHKLQETSGMMAPDKIALWCKS